jgi:hypothetical protein
MPDINSWFQDRAHGEDQDPRYDFENDDVLDRPEFGELPAEREGTQRQQARGHAKRLSEPKPEPKSSKSKVASARGTSKKPRPPRPAKEEIPRGSLSLPPGRPQPGPLVRSSPILSLAESEARRLRQPKRIVPASRGSVKRGKQQAAAAHVDALPRQVSIRSNGSCRVDRPPPCRTAFCGCEPSATSTSASALSGRSTAARLPRIGPDPLQAMQGQSELEH